VNCEQAKQAWHDARDGVLADPAAGAHLAGCRECRAYCEQMTAIDGLLDELRIDSENVVSSRVSTGSARPVRTLRFHRAWLAAAAVAAAVGLGWIVAGLVGGGGQRMVERDGPAGQLGANDAVPGDSAETLDDERRPVSVTRVVLVGETSDRYLAVPAKTSQAGVKLYWLYPTVGNGGANGAS